MTASLAPRGTPTPRSLHVLDGPGVTSGQREALHERHLELARAEAHMRLLARPMLVSFTRRASSRPRRRDTAQA